MSTPVLYDTDDVKWINEDGTTTTFAEWITWDLASLAPKEVLALVAAKLQTYANKLEAFKKFAFAVRAAQALERVAEHKRATPFALVIGELQDRLTKRARTDAIHV
jgi:hypothetical protein